MISTEDYNGLAVGYGELAYAILVWVKRQEVGHTRAQQIDAERTLTLLAQELNAVGYKVGS